MVTDSTARGEVVRFELQRILLNLMDTIEKLPEVQMEKLAMMNENKEWFASLHEILFAKEKGAKAKLRFIVAIAPVGDDGRPTSIRVEKLKQLEVAVLHWFESERFLQLDPEFFSTGSPGEKYRAIRDALVELNHTP